MIAGQKCLISLTIIAVVGCSSSKPPTTPTTPSQDATAANRQDMGENATVDDGESASAEVKLTFMTGGAKVGDADTQDEVKKCHDDKMFFDRFGSDAAVCSDLSLAKVDCSVKGVRKVLSTKQREQFDTAMSGTYKGWLLDQCLDCGKDADSKLCQTSAGDAQEGTKLFFVKEENAEIRGKSLLVPFRPGQSKEVSSSKSSSKAKSSSKSDDESEED